MPALNKNSLAKRTRTDFTQDYKMQIFTLWYNSGKPSAERLFSIIITENIKEPLSGEIPTANTIKKWVGNEFEAKATFLDMEVMKSLEKSLVTNKIELLKRHAEIGKEVYEMGLEHLKENGLGNSRNALTAIIEGLRIEAENSGASVKFNELKDKTNEELWGELLKIIQKGKIVSIEPNDE